MNKVYKAYKDIVILALGWLMLILGIIGCFLPFLQGILFLLIGLYILSKRTIWAQRVLGKIRRRLPRLSGKMEQARWKGERFIARIEKKWQRKKFIKKIKKDYNQKPK
ncbi:MAG: hypothetical protein GX092_06990 [Clostridia bacterium]|jgi:uncharacterized membrane protein YbaN (DUF454 family)|nr:hypothetical protein [Clostridia bacterium]